MNNRSEIASSEERARIDAVSSVITGALKRSNEPDSVVMMNALIHLAVVSAVLERVPLETLLAVVTHQFTAALEQLKASMT